MKKLSVILLGIAALGILWASSGIGFTDTSPRPQRDVVLKRDKQGRPTMLRRRGRNVYLTRDEHGNVIKKAWGDARDRHRIFVRLYTYDEESRLVEEVDIVGHKKLFWYREDGELLKPQAPEGFIEEADQFNIMHSSQRKLPTTTFEYDPKNRLRKKADQ